VLVCGFTGNEYGSDSNGDRDGPEDDQPGQHLLQNEGPQLGDHAAIIPLCDRL
jgi:hypothetical protein